MRQWPSWVPNWHSPKAASFGSALRREWASKGKGAKREQSHAQAAPASEHDEHPPFDRARAKPLGMAVR